MWRKTLQKKKESKAFISFSEVIIPSYWRAISFFFFYFWLLWVFLLHRGFLWLWRAGLLSRCGAAHRGGFSCSGAWALGLAGSTVVTHGLSCSVAREIFPDEGSNLCPLHWQVSSYALCHQGRVQDHWTLRGHQHWEFSGQLLLTESPSALLSSAVTAPGTLLCFSIYCVTLGDWDAHTKGEAALSSSGKIPGICESQGAVLPLSRWTVCPWVSHQGSIGLWNAVLLKWTTSECLVTLILE